MKKVILILLIISFVLSLSIPFAHAADGETKDVQFYSYNGIIAPDITAVWDSVVFPYAFMRFYASANTIDIWFTDRPIKYTTSFITDANIETKYYKVTLNGDSDNYILRGDVQWVRGDIKVSSGRTNLSNYNTANTYWTNTDIVSLNDTQNVFLAASDPVFDKTVSYPVNPPYASPLYDYNGILVPDITSLVNYDLSAYPYVFLSRNGDNINLLLFQTMPYLSGNYLFATSDGFQVRCVRTPNYFENGLPWGTGEVRQIYAERSAGYFGGVERWSNVDVLDKDGNIVYTYVAPVPIINDVSYLDNADVMVNSSTHWINALAVSITQTPFILAFVLVSFVGLSIRIIFRLKK